MFFPISGHFLVQNIRKDLGRKVDHRDGNALQFQIFRNLQTDKSRTDYNRLFHGLFFHVGAQGDGIVRGAHGENARKADTRQWRHGGRGSGGNDQFVIGIGFRSPRFQILYSNGLFTGIYADGFFLCQNRNTREGGIFCRRIHDQLLPFFNQPAHIIGKAAAGIRDVRSFGDHSDFGVPVFPF